MTNYLLTALVATVSPTACLPPLVPFSFIIGSRDDSISAGVGQVREVGGDLGEQREHVGVPSSPGSLCSCSPDG